MQTFERLGIRIHHNGGYSGKALISVDASPRNIEVEVPCSTLLAFAAEYVREKKIAAIEQMEADELLLGVVKKGEE